MNLLPKTKEEFSQKEYWDLFFKKRGNKAFEWYGEYPELSGYIHKYVKTQDNILVMGCGNSSLGKDLYDIGFHKITNIDISNIVIRQMLSQNDKERPGLEYIQMDALHTTFEDEKFSVIIDKGTLDALMPNDNDETIKSIDQYFAEIQRLLKLGGRYLCISLLQEHILNKILLYFPKNDWMFRVVRCFEPETKSVQNGENALPVFMVICTKFKALPRMILEASLGSTNKIDKYNSIEEIISFITSIQTASFVCSSLKKCNINEDAEISLDLYEPGSQSPRYTVHVVEVPYKAKNLPYAAFIIPQGRESEWLFSTKSGRQNLVTMTNHNRLAIVSMHRGKVYESLDAVKSELEDIICNLAPAHLKNHKIAFLSLGSDIGKREIRHQGKSIFSGDYVIEDVEHENGDIFRRLFYLSSQLVIQSEAKIKVIKTRGGKQKNIIDLSTLMCQHHIYMSVATHLAYKIKKNATVAVLGLGGGSLCSFLHKFLPEAVIIGVDIDSEMLEIAKDWFGFKEDEKLRAIIQDGLVYLSDLNKVGQKVEAILCDVDNKNSEIGMSCPPKEFLSPKTLKDVSQSLSEEGVLIVNVVLRDQSLRPNILKDLRTHFKSVVAYKLSEDLNEIFLCSNSNKEEKYFKDNLKVGMEAIKTFFKKNNVNQDVEIVEYINRLNINK
ncbi:eEF1A lysine and N-terminal methyltransferase homolog [Sitophilus oryzae]|uniref:EEF1A lysine and N-terminal methyltransferase homolog n=1 Tax=Sitophilus oryzae TaxID=7048 RepID=A0A6J2XEW0_SITOR|nr:eEF1A lysine and N-terminal methyltransferase homolog [Sitophilus oryzae]